MRIRKGALGIIFRRIDNKYQFLILHRVLHWKGWEFVKGAIEQEDIELALKREIKEETSLDHIEIISKLPYHISYHYPEKYKEEFQHNGGSSNSFSG